MRRLVILFISTYGLLAAAQAPESADGGSMSANVRDPEDAQVCRDLYDLSQCKEYFQKNPQNAKYAVNCGQPPPYEEGFKACGQSFKGVFWDLPASIWTSTSARMAFYNNCAQSYECKRALWKSQTGSPPDEAAEQRLNRLTNGTGLEAMLNSKANVLQGEKNEKIRAMWENESDPAKRESALQKLDPQWKDRKPMQLAALWQASLQAAHQAGDDALDLNTKGNCYSGPVQAKAVCKGLAVMVGGVVGGKALRALGEIKEVSVAQESIAAPTTTATATATAEVSSDPAVLRYFDSHPDIHAALMQDANGGKFIESAKSPAEDRVVTPIEKMSMDTRSAIADYADSNDFKAANVGLRTGEWPIVSSTKDKVKTFIGDLKRGLSTLPKYQGVVFRSARIKDPNILKLLRSNGKVYTDKGFLSSSRSAAVAEKSFPSSGDQGVFMVIRSRTGRSIEGALQNNEQEVLFPPNSRFRVSGGTTRPDGSYVVFLDEI